MTDEENLEQAQAQIDDIEAESLSEDAAEGVAHDMEEAGELASEVAEDIKSEETGDADELDQETDDRAEMLAEDAVAAVAGDTLAEDEVRLAEEDAEASEEAAEQAEETAQAAEEEQPLDAGEQAVREFSKSLRTLDGKWYVLHTYSGYEKRVKSNIESRVASFGLEDTIFQVEVPMEEVEKHTEKGKKVITRVRIPGYVLIRMWPDENARRIVRETEGVTGFVGPTREPAPLTRKEVVQMLAPMIASEALKAAGDKPAAAKKRTLEVSYAVGDQVTVTDGPFTSMEAVVSDIEPTTQKLTVLVSIFGRDTPVELGFNQVEKLD
ncbi:transcription termination/antitermination protein NusG [Bifidobacterium magnum]|uniref:Transcription termination/antitermination protein NusG n=1 Tax=Bifidobacterium magnum TaxID=1692 RepID=A0A087BB50_9BIFI|nr:Transcription termination factor nusG [Bifidobacterium magnum]